MLILNGLKIQIKLTGYVPEIDLEYLQKLHNIHNDYPFAPEKINIPKEWLSDYYLKIANAHNITTAVKELVPNLMNKNIQKFATMSRIRNEIKENTHNTNIVLILILIHKKEQYQIMNLIRISLN